MSNRLMVCSEPLQKEGRPAELRNNRVRQLLKAAEVFKREVFIVHLHRPDRRQFGKGVDIGEVLTQRAGEEDRDDAGKFSCTF